jgi:pimeloyl-ACP methyl ester carboxylesterase
MSLFGIVQDAHGATLPRHGLLGAVLAVQSGAVAIRAIVPGSAAQEAGLQQGDRIKTIDGVRIESIADFFQQVRRAAHNTLMLTIQRGEEERSFTITMKPAPDEVDPRVDTAYDTITVNGTLRRTLVSAPHGAKGRLPAVLFVGGIGCFTVDDANAPFDPYRSLAHDLGRHGFVSLRLEKSGVGDSQGPPCATVDFNHESGSYDVALSALRENPLVDPARIYVFGHSIGSLIGPRLAREHRVAGLIVAEGVGINWFEYELANLRRQLLLSGEKPPQIWVDMQAKEFCMHRFLIEKEDRTKLLRERPDCEQPTEYPVGAAYMQQVAAVNCASLWTRVAIPVLVIYGRSDFVTAESDHQYIVSMVNDAHPGHAKLVVLPRMDHYLAVAASTQDSFRLTNEAAQRSYDGAFSTAVLSWLCTREHCD